MLWIDVLLDFCKLILAGTIGGLAALYLFIWFKNWGVELEEENYRKYVETRQKQYAALDGTAKRRDGNLRLEEPKFTPVKSDCL